jgi:phosphonate transport system substrate-binding protein
MHQDPEGRALLKELMIDRFIAPQEEWYTGIRRMAVELVMMDRGTHALSKPQD